MELAGKVALVTGAAQGLGRAYALALSKAGAHVVASSRSMGNPTDGEAPAPTSLAETGRLAREMGCPVELAVCDVGSEEQINRTVAEVIGNHGRIDILVNNAATYPAHFPAELRDPFVWTTEAWQQYFLINVVGPYLMIRAVADTMKAQRSGSIINISSIADHRDDLAHDGLLGYSVSKAGLTRLSTFFASELAPWGIAVNALCPGVVITSAWSTVPAERVKAALESGSATEASPEAVGAYIVHLAKMDATQMSGKFVEARNYPNWI